MVVDHVMNKRVVPHSLSTLFNFSQNHLLSKLHYYYYYYYYYLQELVLYV